MRKYIKFFCIIIFIIFLLFILNTLRNYFLMNNFLSSQKKYLESLTNYYAIQEVSSTISSNKLYSKTEQYYKDGIYLDKCYQYNELTNLIWINTITKEKIYFDVTNSEEYHPIEDNNYSIMFTLKNFTLSQYIFNFLIPKNNQYRIFLGKNSHIYYNKDTKICEKYEVISELPVTITYSITENCVTDADIAKPEL